MAVVSSFVRSKKGLTPAIFVPAPRPKGRPSVRLRVRVDSEEDANAANKAGVPLFALTSRTVTALGYPIRFPTQLVVASTVRSAVDSSFRMILFNSEEAALRPKIEDVIVALLTIDPVVARVVLERNRDEVRPEYLLKRVLTENQEQLAAWARFFDVVPTLPRLGKSLPAANLDREFRKNLPTGRIP